VQKTRSYTHPCKSCNFLNRIFSRTDETGFTETICGLKEAFGVSETERAINADVKHEIVCGDAVHQIRHKTSPVPIHVYEYEEMS
jgi:hypothetical protein